MPLGRSIHRMSRRGEEKTARQIQGRLQPGSGATPWAKADVKSSTLLVERKDTAGTHYSLKAAELWKIRQQAVLADRLPVFIVSFNGANPPMEVAVVDSAFLFNLLGME